MFLDEVAKEAEVIRKHYAMLTAKEIELHHRLMEQIQTAFFHIDETQMQRIKNCYRAAYHAANAPILLGDCSVPCPLVTCETVSPMSWVTNTHP